MRKRMPGWKRLIGCVVLGFVACTAAAQPGAPVRFPTEGTVNVLVVFVQFPGEPDGAGAFGSDPATEWPHGHSLGPGGALPRWAEDGGLLAPPGTPPAEYAEGSVSAFYHTMSHGRFALTGVVYPRVYHPQHDVDWYHAHREGDPNGAVRLAREVLTAPEVQAFVADPPGGLDPAAFDSYRNGTTVREPDGFFDLVVLLHRDVVLPRLRRAPDGATQPGSSITSLGADLAPPPGEDVDYLDPATDAFASEPVHLGGLRVIDNLSAGSGVTGYALTRKQAVRIVAHELGHRHFGPYHTCDSRISPESDCLSVMGGSYLTLSAGDRVKLGWAEVVPVDVPATGRRDLTFPDALRSGKVFRLRDGADRCGDVIVEARFWSNPWDAPPNPDDPDAPFHGHDDGDAHDLFLPQEGLYLYKAPAYGEPRCGGHRMPELDRHLFSSLENSGSTRRLVPYDEDALAMDAFRLGGTYRVAYGPGDAFLPYARPRFFYHRHDRLDAMLSITNIERADGAFRVEVWMDHLAGPLDDEAGLRVEAFPTPFEDDVTVGFELEAAARVRVTVYDELGRRGPVLADGLHQAGLHRVPFRPDDAWASGRYWVRITVEGEGQGRSVVLPVVRAR